MKFAAALFIALGASSCLSLSWSREQIDEPPRPKAIDSLQPGAELGDCLARLGAPIDVWENDPTGGDGIALAYGWLDGGSKGFDVHVPLSRSGGANFDYTAVARKLPGAVLFFDSNWKLVSIRQGFLRDLIPLRHPARDVDDD